MVFASGYSGVEAEAGAYGWDITLGDFNWDRFKGSMHAELDRLEAIYRRLLANSGVETFDARATVKDSHTVVLSTGEEKTAKHILVAVGGCPTRPNIPNADVGIVSDDLFDLPELPKTMLIIGGGYIASEFAGVMNGLGVSVTQYYRGEQILRGFDNEARTLIADQMVEKGIDLQLGTNIAEMEKRDGRVWVKSTTGVETIFDQVLFATGRKPNTHGLGIEKAGGVLGRGGEIVVDEYSQTGVPSIYAIGDVTNRVNLTPVAIREGMAFVQTVFNANPTPVDHDLIPSAIFTQPEMGTVGLSEEAAAEIEPIEVYATTFKPMQSSFAGKSDRVMMKLIVSQATRVVLGCHIVAPNAGEMIQMAGIAVKMGATKEDFDRTVAVHPTMSEEIVTMKTPTRKT